MAEELNWGDGNYERTARTLEPAAEVALDTAEIAPGERVLDVACGTGNAALAAAQRGARAVGVDPAEALLTIARDRATAVGADAEFIVGGALDLPVADAAFDAVVSVFGVIFAADADGAAAELLRATRPEGRAVLTSWVPSGPTSAVGRALVSALPASAAAPARWGDPERAREMLTRHGGQRQDPRAHPTLHGRVTRRVVCRSRPPPPRLGVGPARGHRRALGAAARRERGTAERRQ